MPAKNDVVFFMNLCRSVSGTHPPDEGALDIVLEQGAALRSFRFTRASTRDRDAEASEDDVGFWHDGTLSEPRKARWGPSPSPPSAEGDIGARTQPRRGIMGGP